MKTQKLLSSYLLLFVAICLNAQQKNQDIPFDNKVKRGVLKNGLTYYIRQNAKPEDKVDLRLVINAGSILEDDNQKGLAHFMEHMCFNGTKRFPKNQLVDYLQSIGVKFGQHLNAYTSFDETVYFLPIPSNDAEKLDKGFQIIEDWAFNTTLTPEEIDKERGVVLEEYRIGLGAEKRMMNRFMPKMMYNSMYAKRLPIGEKEILENFTHDKLIKYYKDWYRPNLMCIIVVGDINPTEIEKKIIAQFSSYENPKNERPRQKFEVPNHNETFVAIEQDKEAAFSQVQLLYKDYEAPKVTKTIADFRENMVKSLFTMMLNNRLDEKVNSPTPPFTFGYTYHGGTFAKTKNAFQSFAMTPEGKQLEALKVLVEENERVKNFGFSQGELERAKAEMIKQYENSFNERDKTESENYVWEYQSHFLSQSPSPGIEWEFEEVKKVVPTITLEETASLISKFIKDDNRVVVFTGPEKEGAKTVTEDAVINALKVDKATIKPYEDKAVASSLIRKPIQPGKIVDKQENKQIEATTITLSNGAKVTYKKTNFKNDEIIFEAVSYGGSNLIDNSNFKKVQWALNGVTEAGISGLKTNDINKFLIGKTVSLSPYVSNITEGMRGNATPKDFEYLFQMIHAYFTDLNFDPEAFEGYKIKENGFYANMFAMPNFYFQNELYSYLNKENPRFNGIIPNDEAWKNTDYQMAYSLFKERFSDASDFNFYFVGNIDSKIIEAFAVQYIGSLPSLNKKESPKDLGYRMLKGEHKKIVNKGKDPKSNVSIMYYGDCVYNAKEALAMQALGEILSIKLIEELRENESGVYGISARGSINKVPYGSYNFNISFPCGPENAENLTNSALREVNKIIENGPEEKDLNKFIEAEKLNLKEKRKENNYWLSNFTRSFVQQKNIEDVLKIEEELNKISAKEIQEVAKKYLTKDKVIAMLMPEK